MSETPDTIFINGTVLTADDGDREAEAVAVARGRVIAVGNGAEIDRMRARSTKVVDLGGRTLMPGLTDPHVHLADDGTNMVNAVDVRDFHRNVSSIGAMLAQIAPQTREQPKGTWIVALGSPIQNMRMPEGRFPTRQELDSVAPDHPVMVTFGAHITIANSKALALAGITKDTEPPKGGHIEHDPTTGELTGKLLERAQMQLRKALGDDVPVGFNPNADVGHLKAGIKFASKAALARGITSVHDIVKTGVAIRAYQELARDRELPLRTDILIRVIEASYGPDALLDMGFVTGFGDDWLRIGGVKLSVDGGITGHAAAFSEPYSDSDGCDCGLIRIPTEELEKTVLKYHKAGHRVCVHAIGDVAMDMTLTAFDKALAAHPRHNHRHRVEHLANWMMTPERLATVKRLELIPVPNITFFYYLFDSLMSYLGPQRMRGAFGLRAMLDAGIPLVTGSDGPAYWPSDPLRDMGVAVNRSTWKKVVFGEEEAIDLRQAMRMVTINAAYSGFAENERGSVEVGKFADFAILSENPFKVSSTAIKDIGVDMTILDGKVAYQADGVELRV